MNHQDCRFWGFFSLGERCWWGRRISQIGIRCWVKSIETVKTFGLKHHAEPQGDVDIYLWGAVYFIVDQFSSVTQSCLTLCNPVDCSTSGLPVHHQLPELTQIHIHGIDDAIQPSHPLRSSSPSAFSLSQHQELFQWVCSSHHVAKVLELQHQSF